MRNDNETTKPDLDKEASAVNHETSSRGTASSSDASHKDHVSNHLTYREGYDATDEEEWSCYVNHWREPLPDVVGVDAAVEESLDLEGIVDARGQECTTTKAYAPKETRAMIVAWLLPVVLVLIAVALVVGLSIGLKAK